jgi:hypothetical protein
MQRRVVDKMQIGRQTGRVSTGETGSEVSGPTRKVVCTREIVSRGERQVPE